MPISNQTLKAHLNVAELFKVGPQNLHEVSTAQAGRYLDVAQAGSSLLQEQLDLHYLLQQLKQLQADEAPDDHLHNVNEASISKLAKYCNNSNL